MTPETFREKSASYLSAGLGLAAGYLTSRYCTESTIRPQDLLIISYTATMGFAFLSKNRPSGLLIENLCLFQATAGLEMLVEYASRQF